MANKVFEYNGKLIRDMSDEELLNAFGHITIVSTDDWGLLRTLRSQILLRMSFRERAREIGVYDCEECGNPYCYEVNKGLGATEPTKIEPGFCGQDCRDAYNQKGDPDESEMNLYLHNRNEARAINREVQRG